VFAVAIRQPLRHISLARSLNVAWQALYINWTEGL
jgi:hypothetical protein